MGRHAACRLRLEESAIRHPGEGFEGAIAYAVAHALGYTDDQIDWTQMLYTDAYKPGPKDFDYYLAQLSYKAKRALTADFSDSYYDVNQAIVALSSNPIAAVTTITAVMGLSAMATMAWLTS